MKETLKDRKYTKTHEWVLFNEDGTADMGLTDFAQEHLSDLVFFGLPNVGDAVKKGCAIGDVESVKAVEEYNSPVDGDIAAVNETLLDNPGSVNADPYGVWVVRIGNITAEGELMDADAYDAFCTEALKDEE
jgi:glycine cleavage system H protein